RLGRLIDRFAIGEAAKVVPSPDGARFLVTRKGGSTELVVLSRRRVVETFPGSIAAVSGDGARFVAGGGLNCVPDPCGRTLTFFRGSERRQLRCDEPVVGAEFIADGRALLVVTTKQVYVRDVNAAPPRIVWAPTMKFSAVAASVDGERLVVACDGDLGP